MTAASYVRLLDLAPKCSKVQSICRFSSRHLACSLSSGHGTHAYTFCMCSRCCKPGSGWESTCGTMLSFSWWRWRLACEWSHLASLHLRLARRGQLTRTASCISPVVTSAGAGRTLSRREGFRVCAKREVCPSTARGRGSASGGLVSVQEAKGAAKRHGG